MKAKIYLQGEHQRRFLVARVIPVSQNQFRVMKLYTPKEYTPGVRFDKYLSATDLIVDGTFCVQNTKFKERKKMKFSEKYLFGFEPVSMLV